MHRAAWPSGESVGRVPLAQAHGRLVGTMAEVGGVQRSASLAFRGEEHAAAGPEVAHVRPVIPGEVALALVAGEASDGLAARV